MPDLGTKYTDKKIKKLDKQLAAIYAEAEKDIEKKLEDFNKKFAAKEAIHLQELKDGKITQADFNAWRRGQEFQGRQWQAKKDQITKILYNSNTIAANMINKQSLGVFAENANYMAYSLEKQAGISLGFQLYDVNTVERLAKDDPQLLPKWKINEKKDYIWNQKKLNNCITQGIIQGETLQQITKRISSNLVMQNENLSKTFARTSMTGAQNAGRNQNLMDARTKGIRVVKEWMATLDGRTRDSHRHMDGEQIEVSDYRHPMKFSNGCRYPGDPQGPPHEVYNCRCTLVGDLLNYPAEYERYDNIDGITVKNMTYNEWHHAKFSSEHRSAQNFVWNKHYTGVPNRDYGKADTSDALYEIQHGKSNSLSGYLDENGNLTPEREALHKQIIDNYLSGKLPEEGTATMVMMGGGPASGKSSVIKSGLYQLPDENRTMTIDPDDIKSYLPGYLKRSKVDSTAASFYHEESSMLAKQLASTCFSENFNVVYDGTGDGSINSVMKKINGAKKQGYKVNGMYVTVDIDEALKRNKSRYDHAVAKGESPRLVPDAYVIDCHKKVTQISMEVSDQFDNISLYDNNGDSGSIKLIGIGGDGKKLHAVSGEEEAFEKFLDKMK